MILIGHYFKPYIPLVFADWINLTEDEKSNSEYPQYYYVDSNGNPLTREQYTGKIYSINSDNKTETITRCREPYNNEVFYVVIPGRHYDYVLENYDQFLIGYFFEEIERWEGPGTTTSKLYMRELTAENGSQPGVILEREDITTPEVYEDIVTMRI